MRYLHWADLRLAERGAAFPTDLGSDMGWRRSFGAIEQSRRLWGRMTDTDACVLSSGSCKTDVNACLFDRRMV